MPKPAARPQLDESHLVAAAIRDIVKHVACPTCARRAGLPCANLVYYKMASVSDKGQLLSPTHTPLKRKRRLNYQAYVHRSRRKAYEQHCSTAKA